MWNTPDGDRKLKGAEKKLVVLSALQYVDFLTDMNEDYEDVVVRPLHLVPPADLIPLLVQVLEHITDDKPAPNLVAWNAAIVYAIYSNISVLLDYEIDREEMDGPSKENFFIRQAILDSVRKIDPEFKVPKVTSKKRKEWHSLIGLLEEIFTWDTDFNLYETFADLPSHKTDRIKERIDIEEDYYSASPPPITQEEKTRLTAFLRKIAQEADGWIEDYKETGKVD